MSSSSLPTLVFVHGAWHTPPIYEPYISALRSRGFSVRVPSLPSCNGVLPPNKTFADDVAAVRAVVQHLTDAGERIIMVLHSYGGAVGTDAVANLTLPERKAQGLQGGVVHMVYLCAYILPPGGSVMGVVRQAGVEHLWPLFVTNFDDGSCYPKDAAELFLNGDRREELFKLAEPHLVRHPLETFEAKTSGDAWSKVPATYAMTLQDHSVPKMYQDIMLSRVKEEGVELRIEEYDTNHSIFLMEEEKMVELVMNAMKDERNPV